MRLVFALTFSILATLAVPAWAADPQTSKSPNLTLVLKFDTDHSERSLQEMKRELGNIMKDTGIQLDFRLMSELDQHPAFNDVVLVKFRGHCRMELLPAIFDERGPLAFTHTSDGDVLPFSEVACDRIRSSVASAINSASERKNADMLLGRALGRVVAHELYHIVAKTGKHGTKGSVAQTSLSGAQLISEKLALHDADVHKLRPLQGTE
jgi:hypothetical protein